MFDTHYDLLSIAYCAYLKNDYSYLEKISKYFNTNNVNGVFANLYFMSKEEMIEELDENYYKDDVSVLDMFIKAKKVLDTFLPDNKIVYSIEGADYISGPEELEKLYEAGLDSLILCWNTESRYASGNRSDKGLTDEGRKLLDKCIELGIAIDLSHANRKTFNDCIDYIREKQNNGYEVTSLASHSNYYPLCMRDRNLDDEQINKLKSIGGKIGLLSHKNFVVLSSLADSNTDYEEAYLNHIEKVMTIMGEDNVMVSTDDMGFASESDPDYLKFPIYKYETIKTKLQEGLVNRFGLGVAEKVLYLNANKIHDDLKENKINKNRGGKI